MDDLEPDLGNGDDTSPRTATRAVAMPERVGRYAILEQLGVGGMGVVFHALDTELERAVALKRPRTDVGDPETVRERMLREARAASRLHHPHVVQVFEVFEHDGVPWMAMELVRGLSLARIIDDKGPLPIDQVLRHAEGLADALAAAHGLGILHRDVNPGNVLIGADGRARLTDFGLTRPTAEAAVGSDGTITLTAPGMVAGTAGYMSPEQAFGRPLDGRSDLFNLGLVIYEMATGRKAFPPGRSLEWLDALIHRPPTPVAELRAHVSPELVRIIDRCLAKEPDDRYRDAAALRADLEGLRRRTESGLLLAAEPRRASLAQTAAIAAGAAVLVLAVVAGVLWLRRPVYDPLDHLIDWTPRQLTSAPGWEGDPALSPDGTLVAYASDESGDNEIWVLDLEGGGNPLRLTDHPSSDRHPCWLPDGTALLYTSDRGGQLGIWRVPRLGGAPTRLVASGKDPAVSPDGRRLAFSRADESGFYRIWVAPMTDPEAAVQLTQPDDGLWNHTQPAWSPDGRTICYAGDRDLWLVEPEGGRPRPLTDEGIFDTEPAWTPDGRGIVFSSARATGSALGTYGLWRVKLGVPEPDRLTQSAAVFRSATLAATGRRVCYSTAVMKRQAGLVVRTDRTTSSLRIIEQAHDPALAPDGRFLVYNTATSERQRLALVNLRDAVPQDEPVALDVRGLCNVPVVSPDGRWVACHLVVDGERDIWVVPVDGSPAVRFTWSPSIDVNPAFSPDGRRLAFSSDQDGSAHIWVAGFDGASGRMVGEPWQLTFGEGQDFHPCWSPDGSKIAFIRYSNGAEDILVAPVGVDGPTRQLTSGSLVYHVRWLAGEDGLVACGLWDRSRWTLAQLSVDDGRLMPFLPEIDMGPLEGGGSFDLTDDGRILAFDRNLETGDVWLLDAPARSE